MLYVVNVAVRTARWRWCSCCPSTRRWRRWSRCTTTSSPSPTTCGSPSPNPVSKIHTQPTSEYHTIIPRPLSTFFNLLTIRFIRLISNFWAQMKCYNYNRLYRWQRPVLPVASSDSCVACKMDFLICSWPRIVYDLSLKSRIMLDWNF